MKDGLSSLSSGAAWLTARAAVAAMIAGAAIAACSLDTGGTGQSPPTGTGGMGGAGGSGASGPGGSGGAGATGGAGGAGGAGGGATTLAEWDGGTPDPVSGTYDLPAWLSFESPSTNKTVQTGPDSLRTGFDADAARARSVDGVSWGLAVEGERTNRMLATRYAVGGSWTTFNASMGPTTGPDETDLARLITDQSTTMQGALVIYFLPAVGATSTVSAWMSTPATNTVDSTLESNNLTPATVESIDPGTSWRRISFSGVENADPALVRLRAAMGDAAQTGAASIDFVSIETGRYPSSVIITDPTAVGSNAPQTRTAEKLYVATPAGVAPDGYFHVVLTFAPHYAAGEQASEHDLLYFDDMNRLYLRTDNVVALQEGGADVLATSPLTWTRDQAITVEVMNTVTTRSLRVSVEGGSNETVPGSPGAAFPLPGPLHLLGNTTGSQEGADLRSIVFHPPM